MARPLSTLRLGARGSLLSRMQSQLVADQLQAAHPGLTVELVLIKTTGDRITDKPLHDAGGKGLFTKEIELALLANEIDVAVHSYKDVPVTMPLVDQADLIIAATPKREDPRDVLACGIAKNIMDLPQGASVGTGSLRRRSQLLALRPDLDVQLIRGNIDTRLRKLHEGQYHAIILACSGLRRANLFNPAEMTPIEPDQMLPAAGQGALAIQCRRSDAQIQALLAALHDPATARCVDLEREVVRALEGDCHSPIAALARMDDNQITLTVSVGKAGGHPPLLGASAGGPADQPAAVLSQVIDRLKQQHVHAHLHPAGA